MPSLFLHLPTPPPATPAATATATALDHSLSEESEALFYGHLGVISASILALRDGKQAWGMGGTLNRAKELVWHATTVCVDTTWGGRIGKFAKSRGGPVLGKKRKQCAVPDNLAIKASRWRRWRCTISCKGLYGCPEHPAITLEEVEEEGYPEMDAYFQKESTKTYRIQKRAHVFSRPSGGRVAYARRPPPGCVQALPDLHNPSPVVLGLFLPP